MGEYLYHYTTYSKFINGISKTNSIRFNPILNVNDPLDYNERLFQNKQLFNNGESKKRITEGYRVFKRTLKEKWINNCKILCFSTDNKTEKINGFQLANLWSYYAENHSGLCLKFSKQKTLKYFDSNFNIFYPLKKNVEYISKLNYFTFHTDYLNNEFKGINDNQNSLFFEKLNVWNREQEYRLVCFSKNKYEYIPINEILSEIILGQRFSKEHELIVKNKYPNIPISKMNYSRGSGIFDKLSINDNYWLESSEL